MTGARRASAAAGSANPVMLALGGRSVLDATGDKNPLPEVSARVVTLADSALRLRGPIVRSIRRTRSEPERASPGAMRPDVS